MFNCVFNFNILAVVLSGILGGSQIYIRGPCAPRRPPSGKILTCAQVLAYHRQRISGGRLYFETGSSYISAANWDIWTKFGLLIDFDLPKAVTSTNRKPEVVFSGRGRHFEKWIWRHIYAVGAPIWTKFDSLIQNDMHIAANWSRSKPEVEFQYGGRLYFETESSCISAANWDISTKFGLLIGYDLLKAVTSTNTKPEVVFTSRGRHLE